MNSRHPSEDARYKLYRYGAHGAWWAAFAWTALLTYVNLTRPITAPPGAFQRVSGIGIILLMGVAIALGSALSRMRLAKTILTVFETGEKVAELRNLAAEKRVEEVGMQLDEVRVEKALLDVRRKQQEDDENQAEKR